MKPIRIIVVVAIIGCTPIARVQAQDAPSAGRVAAELQQTLATGAHLEGLGLTVVELDGRVVVHGFVDDLEQINRIRDHVDDTGGADLVDVRTIR